LCLPGYSCSPPRASRSTAIACRRAQRPLRWASPPADPQFAIPLPLTPRRHHTPPKLIRPRRSFCEDHPSDPSWAEVCSTLPRAWAAGGRAVHYTIYFSHRDEHVLRYNTGWNAGDAVLPWATRMAFTYFLGHPAEWIMREAHAKTTSTGLVIADDTRTLALMVGGGGLFYSRNGASQLY